jgi:hypothetical protein
MGPAPCISRGLDDNYFTRYATTGVRRPDCSCGKESVRCMLAAFVTVDVLAMAIK